MARAPGSPYCMGAPSAQSRHSVIMPDHHFLLHTQMICLITLYFLLRPLHVSAQADCARTTKDTRANVTEERFMGKLFAFCRYL